MFDTQAACYFPAKVPSHAIRHSQQQMAAGYLDESRLDIGRNTVSLQAANLMMVLVVAPLAAHVSDLSDTHPEMRGVRLFPA